MCVWTDTWLCRYEFLSVGRGQIEELLVDLNILRDVGDRTALAEAVVVAENLSPTDQGFLRPVVDCEQVVRIVGSPARSDDDITDSLVLEAELDCLAIELLNLRRSQRDALHPVEHLVELLNLSHHALDGWLDLFKDIPLMANADLLELRADHKSVRADEPIDAEGDGECA